MAASPSDRFATEGLTFDDVLLVPAASDVLPNEVSTASFVTPGIQIQVPILSAAMDTVTEASLAIAMARAGGIGIVHRNLSVADQAGEVDKVKRSESGMIVDPVTLGPDALVADALELMARFKISGVPITDEDRRLVGILTNRDLRFHEDVNERIGVVMTKEGLITAPQGTTLEEAQAILGRHRIEKLPVVDPEGRLSGLITVKDIQKRIQYPDSTKDDQGRLRCGAAVGTGPDAFERALALIEAGVDLLVVDTAHGHSAGVVNLVAKVVEEFAVPIVAGNVATSDGAKALLDAGASAIKIGVGPGSICTTRVVAGVGVPQLTAIADAGVGALVGIIFPPAILGSAIVGAGAGGLIGHLKGGISRDDLKELGEELEAGNAAVIVIGESKIEEQLEKAVTRANKLIEKQIDADAEELKREIDAAAKEDAA